MGHQLVAAVGAGGHHDHRLALLAHRQDRRGPAGSGVRREAVAADVRRRCGRRTPPAPCAARRSTSPHHDGVDRHAAARGGQVAGEGQRLQRHLDGRAVEVLLDQGEDHRDSTPSSSNRSTTAGAAAGALAQDLHVARHRRRQGQLHPLRSGGLRRGRALLDRHLLGLHPARARSGSAARRRPPGSSRRRAAAPGRSRRPSGPSTRAVTSAVGDRDHLGAVDDRTAELVGEPDADLEVAAVGGVVAEQHQVVGGARGLVAPDHRGDLAGDVGRAERRRLGLDQRRRGGSRPPGPSAAARPRRRRRGSAPRLAAGRAR